MADKSNFFGGDVGGVGGEIQTTTSNSKTILLSSCTSHLRSRQVTAQFDPKPSPTSKMTTGLCGCLRWQLHYGRGTLQIRLQVQGQGRSYPSASQTAQNGHRSKRLACRASWGEGDTEWPVVTQEASWVSTNLVIVSAKFCFILLVSLSGLGFAQPWNGSGFGASVCLPRRQALVVCLYMRCIGWNPWRGPYGMGTRPVKSLGGDFRWIAYIFHSPDD